MRVESKLGKGTTFIINIKTKCVKKETVFKEDAVEEEEATENVEFLQMGHDSNQLESIVVERKKL